jgi:hypothetical protein
MDTAPGSRIKGSKAIEVEDEPFVSKASRCGIAVHIDWLGLKPKLLRDVVEVSSRAPAVREEALSRLEVAAAHKKADLVRGRLKVLGESQQLWGEIKILFPLDAIEDRRWLKLFLFDGI